MARFLNQSAPGAVELKKKCPVCGNKYIYLVRFKHSRVFVHPYKGLCQEDANEIGA
jgi:predicted RNA-binding Zn-ribbon protein involved in translation (DUF1610 family)